MVTSDLWTYLLGPLAGFVLTLIALFTVSRERYSWVPGVLHRKMLLDKESRIIELEKEKTDLEVELKQCREKYNRDRDQIMYSLLSMKAEAVLTVKALLKGDEDANKSNQQDRNRD